MISDYGKLLLMCVILAGAFAMVISGEAELGDVDYIITAVLAYTAGNGVSALTKRAPSVMITAKPAENEVITSEGPRPLVGVVAPYSPETVDKDKTPSNGPAFDMAAIPGEDRSWNNETGYARTKPVDDAWADPENHPFFKD